MLAGWCDPHLLDIQERLGLDQFAQLAEAVVAVREASRLLCSCPPAALEQLDRVAYGE